MSYSVHTLNIKKHVHIVGRQDGITGDTIKAGDEVVFCAACQSVFLKDSWEYMNRQHCGQAETLGFVPAPVPNLIAKKKEAKLIFETSIKLGVATLGCLLPIYTLISFFFLNYCFFRIIDYIPPLPFPKIVNFLLALVGYIGGVIFLMLPILAFENKWFRKIIGIDNKTIRILETGIELKKNKTHLFYDIQKIIYTKNNKQNKLTLYLKNGEIISHKLPRDEYEKTKSFLFGLVWVAQFVPTSVYLSDQKELGMAKSIERNYDAQFSVSRIKQNLKYVI